MLWVENAGNIDLVITFKIGRIGGGKDALGACGSNIRRLLVIRGKTGTHKPTREVAVSNFVVNIVVIVIIMMTFSRGLGSEKFSKERTSIIDLAVSQLRTSKAEPNNPEDSNKNPEDSPGLVGSQKSFYLRLEVCLFHENRF